MTDTATQASVAIARPANTTAYSAGDVIGVADSATPSSAGSAILSFTLRGIASGQAMITGADLLLPLTSVPSGMTSFRLHLYDTSPTAILDNAAWDLPSGDRGYYLGYIDVGTPVDVGSTLFVQTDQINKQVTLKGGTLYGVLVTNGGFTPTSGAVYTVRLHAIGVG
jgi:hypothetical protein